MRKFMIIFVIASLLVGCGQSGNLYLPPKPITKNKTKTPHES